MFAGPDRPIRSALIGTSTLLGRILLFVVINIVTGSGGLRLTRMEAPDVVDHRDGLQLDCHFDMGTEELYAVKWYKDDQEFFRYMPQQKPHTILFPVSGVNVAHQGSECDSTRCMVRLDTLSSRYSSGAYRCEISSEAPAFRLAAETHNVTVAALPREKPKIDGLASTYNDGDILTAECTSDFAYPVPVLRWYVNGEATVPVARPTIVERKDDILMAQTTIQLRLVISGNLSKGNSIQIGCEAVVPNINFNPQLTNVNVPLRTHHGDGVASNEKLQLWYSPFSSSSTLRCSSCQIALSIVLIMALRWSLSR